MSLVVENLKFAYEYSDFAFLQDSLLENINFTLEAGCILHITGQNGSGKTTLLKLLSGILSPCMGDIKYEGKSIFPASIIYNNAICYVGHKLGLNLQLSVFENCRFDLKNSKNDAEILDILQDFNLEELHAKSCIQLSAGQKKRVSLLRLLLSSSKMWILDEPFTALDKEFLQVFMGYMRDHLQTGGMIVYTSHQRLEFSGLKHIEYSL